MPGSCDILMEINKKSQAVRYSKGAPRNSYVLRHEKGGILVSTFRLRAAGNLVVIPITLVVIIGYKLQFENFKNDSDISGLI